MLKKYFLFTLIISSTNLFSQEIFKEFSDSKYTYVKLLGKTDKNFLMMAYTGELGFEPWFSDGTPEGTILLKDIFNGQNSSFISNWCYHNDSLYFFLIRDTFAQIESVKLYRTDGTPEGTFPIFTFKYSYPSDYNHEGAIFNGLLYFPETDTNGTRIWVSDGTKQGTKLFYDNSDAVAQSEVSMYIFNSQLFFNLNTNTYGNELWVSDGSLAGTKLFKDIKTGNESGIDKTFNPIECNGKLYFFAIENEYVSSELFETDGTSIGTKFTIETNSNPYTSSVLNFTNFNDESILISGWEMSKTSVYLYNTNTKALTKILPSSNDTDNSAYVYFGNFHCNTKNIITILDNKLGAELYYTDGTEKGTRLLKDIDPGINSGIMYSPVELGNKLYLFGFNSMLGVDIWSTDGTTQNTVIAKEFASFNQSSEGLFVFQNKLFFTAVEDENSFNQFYVWDVTKNTSINQTNKLKKIVVYPNPVSAGEIIHISGLSQFKYTIYSLIGAELQSGYSDNGKISISNTIGNGTYIVHLENSGVLHTITIKIQ